MVVVVVAAAAAWWQWQWVEAAVSAVLTVVVKAGSACGGGVKCH